MKLPKPAAAFVRLRHPTEQGVYYSKTEAAWVRQGWTAWTIEEWRERGFERPENQDGRRWEFFGYRINLRDDED